MEVCEIKIKSIIIICIVILACSGCNSNTTITSQLQEPPTLFLYYEDTEYEGILGTYSWRYRLSNGSFQGVCADSLAPPGLVDCQEDIITVNPHTYIDFTFEVEPTTIEVRIWDNLNQTKPAELSKDSKSILIPQENDTVIFEVIGEWNQGKAYYAFEVTINNN